jgi:hypothetical protein
MSRHGSKSAISSIERSMASIGTAVGDGPQVTPEQRLHMIAEANGVVYRFSVRS